ncbi:MAG: hypothetical protein ACE37F_35350 [Nannocystaceae bacterium]|nr:hypothetical protein [bacterium]
MAFDHQPLSQDEMGPAAWKMVGADAPPPMRQMVAGGMAPLPPRDLLVALYHLWIDDPTGLGEQAAKTLVGLPPAIIGGALGDPNLPPGVLDFVARRMARKEDVLELVVRHPRVDDESLAAISRACPEGICDLLAENQQRWLAFPAIVEALYQNPNCRMSVAQRMIELAIRQGVDLKLPNIEEIKIALGDGAAQTAPAQDAAFKQAMGREVMAQHDRYVATLEQAGVGEDVAPEEIREAPSELDDLDLDALLGGGATDDLSLPIDGSEPEAPTEAPQEEAEEEVKGDRLSQITMLPVMQKIRLAMLGNSFERSVLIRDSNKQVALSVIKSARVKENEAIAFAANRALSHDVIRHIATRKEWLKLYQLKLNLVLNPKTPLSSAMTFLNHLHPHDIRKVSRSRNIPAALAKAAKRKEQQRR